MKKWLVLLIASLLCACLACAAAEEAEPETFTSGDYRYILLGDGTAEITKYNGEAETLEIPAMLDGHPVTSIGNNAFNWRSSLTSVTIPNSIRNVGVNPFAGCENLSVIRVSLEHPTLAVIDGVLFSKADKRLICYPAGNQGTEYVIPQGIQVIGDSAFSCCSSLTSITIPDSVTNISVNPLVHCDNLSIIRVSPDHPALAVIDGVLFSKADKRLVCYPAGKQGTEYEVPQGIQVIGDSAFQYCKSLTSITIPNSVTSIGNSAFSGCSLTSVAFPESVTNIEHGAFSVCSNLTSVTIPEGITSIGDNMFFHCRNLTSVTIPESVISIGKNAFCNCLSITSITIPDSVTNIEHGAFSGCSNLTNVTIPESVISIGAGAFIHCRSLISVTIPEGVTSIGDDAFGGCSSLTSITIPESVTSIGDDAFSDCANLAFTVPRDSYAAQYCKENNLNYTYPDALDWLNN